MSRGLAGSEMSYWRRSPCSQLEKYRKRSSIETTRSVIRPGTGNGQPSCSMPSTAITLSARVGAVVAVEVPHRARQRGADEALVGVGVVQPAHLQRHQPGLAELERLLDPALAQVPEVQAAAVAPGGDVVEIEPGLVGVGLAELRRRQHVLARLIPEVVVERRVRPAVLPPALDLERARVQHGEAAGAVAVGVAEHADHDVLARHAVDGVRARQPGRADDLLGLDHLLDPRPPRIVGDVDDVDPRGAEAGDDQMRAVRPVARRAAAVPAEVMQLVADVRHRRLVDDPPVLGIDHGEEVRLVHARALVQARDVQELLGRRVTRLFGRGMKRGGGALLVGLAHRAPPSVSDCGRCLARVLAATNEMLSTS